MGYELRRLDLLDLGEIKFLFWECHTAEEQRRCSKQKVEFNESYVQSLWDRWIPGVSKYYLSVVDKDHVLYGIFVNDRLMCMLGWRSDLPAPYDKDWIIVYLKSTPDINATMEYMPILWRHMFDVCESRGLVRYHSLIEPHRLNKYDSFYRRKIPEIDNRYNFETTLLIQSGTRPEVDWVWAMMGRKTLETDCIVRTGTLKSIS